jgi:RNA 3'-terminal phosphate cyclase (ATP)
MITIDGSLGEGGGQILRSSLALSLVTGQPFQMTNIRAKRKKPGLMRQHLTAVHAAAKVGDAAVDGASIGSINLIFKPGKVRAGHYTFAIGTAGSATLVAQTILPALLSASAESLITLEGGTHNPFAPPWDFLAKSFLPLINKMGPKVETELLSYGFYPAGGGKFTIAISPAKINAIELLERGEIIHRSARAIVSNLSLKIAHRELKVVAESLNWPKELLHAEEQKSNGPGNVLMI